MTPEEFHTGIASHRTPHGCDPAGTGGSAG